MEFHYIDLRCFCYATESIDKVKGAIGFYLPPETEIEIEENEGYHGDRIIVLSTRLENKDDIRYVMNRVLEAPGFSGVKDEIEDRVDEDCFFHIRMDKQAAYREKASLGEGIDISAKVEAYPAKHHKAVAAVRRSITDLEPD